MNIYLKNTKYIFSFIAATCLMLVSALEALAVSPPAISPGTGVYDQIQSSVTLTGGIGDTIYYTTNGSQPSHLTSPVYSSPISISDKAVIKAIARNGGVNSTVSVANIQSDVNSKPVSRADLVIWLKSDFGIETGGGSDVTRWNDLSGAATPSDFEQSSSPDRPVVVTGAINGIDAVQFDGISQFMQLPAGIADLSSGISIFAVIKPIGSSTHTLFTMGQNPDDTAGLLTLANQAEFQAYNSSTSSALTSNSNTLVQDFFQIVDVIHDGSTNALINIDAADVGSGTVQTLQNTARNFNLLGANQSVTDFWEGQLAELIVYNRPLTSAERAAIQGYLLSKYQFTTAQNVPDPIFSVPGGSLTAPTRVAIASRGDCEIHFTVDGTTPNSGSQIYDKPINIPFSLTLKAIAISQGVSSNVTTESYTLNATDFPAPDPLDTDPLKIELQLPTTTQ